LIIRKGKRCLTLDDLVGESREDVLETLSGNLIKEAERVIQHVKELEAMFSPSEVDEDEGGTAEAIAEVLPVLDALVNSREAAQGEPQRRISRSPDLRVRPRFLVQFRY